MISLLGIPYDASSTYMRGPAKAPACIRKALQNPSSNLSIENGLSFDHPEYVEDLGDLAFMSRLGDEIGSATAQQAEQVEQAEQVRIKIKSAISDLIAKGNKSLVLGGDHSISLPVISAFAETYPQLHIIQFDAHPDLYDQLDGDRFSHASPFARLLEQYPHLELTQVGIRTMNSHCRAQADRFGVRVFEMRDFPAPSVMNIEGPVYISVDLDVLDPAFAPGVSHYEPGGLSVRELLSFIHSVQNPIVGADVVELNPLRDRDTQTAMVAAKVVKELAGQMITNDL